MPGIRPCGIGRIVTAVEWISKQQDDLFFVSLSKHHIIHYSRTVAFIALLLSYTFITFPVVNNYAADSHYPSGGVVQIPGHDGNVVTDDTSGAGIPFSEFQKRREVRNFMKLVTVASFNIYSGVNAVFTHLSDAYPIKPAYYTFLFRYHLF